jgi:double-stranded uracil-DNA glycosylase
VVARATARAAELTDDQLRDGGRKLLAKAESFGPRWLAIVGVTAYRTAFGEARATIGPQARTAGATRLWVLPNPSGLNAHKTVAQLAADFAELRAQAMD